MKRSASLYSLNRLNVQNLARRSTNFICCLVLYRWRSWDRYVLSPGVYRSLEPIRVIWIWEFENLGGIVVESICLLIKEIKALVRRLEF